MAGLDVKDILSLAWPNNILTLITVGALGVAWTYVCSRNLPNREERELSSKMASKEKVLIAAINEKEINQDVKVELIKQWLDQ